MIALLLEPFTYDYMWRAIWVASLVGGVCAFLSCYLMLKGWALMGDALAHAVVPGVALAYLLALPYALGAFFAGLLAAFSMAVVRQKTTLREDAVIGVVFTAFFALGLLLISLNPMAVNIQTLVLGNILTISAGDAQQVVMIALFCAVILLLKWRDFLWVFFDEAHARSLGMPVLALKIIFFTLLSAACVAGLQTVGACLVIALVVTPGATAYLLTDRFGWLLTVAVSIGVFSSAFGAYASYFLNTSTGGLIVCLQTLFFLGAFLGAPKYGVLRRQRRLRHAAEKKVKA